MKSLPYLQYTLLGVEDSSSLRRGQGSTEVCLDDACARAMMHRQNCVSEKSVKGEKPSPNPSLEGRGVLNPIPLSGRDGGIGIGFQQP